MKTIFLKINNIYLKITIIIRAKASIYIIFILNKNINFTELISYFLEESLLIEVVK